MTKNLWCVQNISEYVLKLKHNAARRRRWICVYTHFWLMYHVRRMLVWCVSACWIFTCFAMLENHEPPHGRRSVPCITLGALTRAFEKPWPQGFLPECSLTENMVQTCLVALYPVDKAWLVTGRTPRWWELKLTFSNFRAFHRGTLMKMPENSWKFQNSIQFHGKAPETWEVFSSLWLLSPRHPKCAVAPESGSFSKQRELRSEWRDVALAFPKSLEVTASSLTFSDPLTKINRGNEAGNCTCLWCISFFSCGWCEKCSGRFTFSALQR